MHDRETPLEAAPEVASVARHDSARRSDRDAPAEPAASAPSRVPAGVPSDAGEVAALPGSARNAPEDLSAAWESLQDAIRQRVQSEQFETWFRRAALTRLDEGTVRLAVQNGFTRDWLNNYYRAVLEQSVASVFGPGRTLEFAVDPELMVVRRDVPEAAPVASAPAPEPPRGSTGGPSSAPPRRGILEASDTQLNPTYLFDSYVVGPCNRFAHAAAVGVSESPGQAYNPFFMHGSVGLGKTHLLQSLCHAILERQEDAQILYLSCETFVNHFIGALENGDLQKFRTKYRNVDVLVVDDIHLLANKERTQEAFFHTFNTLYNAGKQIVLSSDSPPKDIPTLQGRLVSRFKWGLVTEIEKPCFETRVAILKRKSRVRGHELRDDVAGLLAEHIDTNIRELEGAVTKLLGFANLSSKPITTDLARECLRDVFQERPGQPSMEDILRLVTEHFGVKLSDLQSRKRTNAIAFPRQVGMYLARKVTRLSLEDIGGFFGGRDHSTVLYAIQKLDKLQETDPKTGDLLRTLLIQAGFRGR
jgi:chromosomal replication initiator protein